MVNQPLSAKKEPVVLSWSGGKDSAMLAYHLLASEKYEIISLLTSVTEGTDRVSVHAVRRELVQQQAEALSLPLQTVMIPASCPNALYETRMNEAFDRFKLRGIDTVAFGDLFLDSIRTYRDAQLARAGMSAIYPIWMRDTGVRSAEFIRTFINLGFKAKITCVDTHAIDASFAGREINEQFLRDLPHGADPCGENGEFHSFVYDGPIFNSAIRCAAGEAGEAASSSSRFRYCDLTPAAA